MASPITTHVLDTSRGRPAAGVAVVLERQAEGGEWKEIGRSRTNADGRAADLLPEGSGLDGGAYRLTFETGEYFRQLGAPAFFPLVTVTFHVQDHAQHYHVPLLLSPFGYTTYRGS